MKKLTLSVLALVMALGFLATPASAAGPDDYGDSRMEYNWLIHKTYSQLRCRNAYVDSIYGGLARCINVTQNSNGTWYGHAGYYSVVNGTWNPDGNGLDTTVSDTVDWPYQGASAWCNLSGTPTPYEYHGSQALNTGYGPVSFGYIWRNGVGGNNVDAMVVTYSPLTGVCTPDNGTWQDAHPLGNPPGWT